MSGNKTASLTPSSPSNVVSYPHDPQGETGGRRHEQRDRHRADAPLIPEEQQAWVPLVQGMLHLLSTLDDELKQALDLSHLDYGILMLLRLAPQQRRRMTELATNFGVEPNVITYRVRRLEEHGWVRRGRCAEDKRGVYAFLTEVGLALLGQAMPLHVAGVRRHFLDHVSPAQLTALAEIFGPLQRRQIAVPDTEAAAQEQDSASVEQQDRIDPLDTNIPG